MFKWILGMPYVWSVIIGGAVVLTYTLISGMLGVTKNMQIQYVIIIISFLIPLFILTVKFDYFWLLPQIGYGSVVSDAVTGIPLVAQEQLVNSFGHAYAMVPTPEYAMPWDSATGKTFFQWMAIAFSLMVGTAGLPHVIQRFYVVPKARDARWSVVWGLFFICILYWSAPAYAAFGKVLSANPEVGKLAKDAIVVYTAQLGNVNHLIVGLLAAGGVSAAFSTVSGLLVAGSSAFAHDLYVKVINPQAPPKTQLMMDSFRNNSNGYYSYHDRPFRPCTYRTTGGCCFFISRMYNIPIILIRNMVEWLKPSGSNCRFNNRRLGFVNSYNIFHCR